ncbi:hypothetical protein GCM10009603_20880 [Nocardiopsis exhalans]
MTAGGLGPGLRLRLRLRLRERYYGKTTVKRPARGSRPRLPVTLRVRARLFWERIHA